MYIYQYYFTATLALSRYTHTGAQTRLTTLKKTNTKINSKYLRINGKCNVEIGPTTNC